MTTYDRKYSVAVNGRLSYFSDSIVAKDAFVDAIFHAEPDDRIEFTRYTKTRKVSSSRIYVCEDVRFYAELSE